MSILTFIYFNRLKKKLIISRGEQKIKQLIKLKKKTERTEPKKNQINRLKNNKKVPVWFSF